MDNDYINLAVAICIGLLIGIERGWNSRHKIEGERVAGVRTFSLIGILGAITGFFTKQYGIIVFVVIFLSLSALVVAGYILSAKKSFSDKGMTTEIASLITLLLSTTSAIGYPMIAAGGAVILVSFLGLKKYLHDWVASLKKEELLASLKLLLLSLVVLPLLPDKDYGKVGTINPYEVGWMVVLIAGVSFIGYIGVKLAGAKKGLSITAIFGGLASSTAVAISFAKLAKQHKNIQRILASGVILASSIMFPRILLEVAVVNSNLLPLVIVPVSFMFLICLITTWKLWRSLKLQDEKTDQLKLKNPFEIMSALKFGLILMVVMYLSQVIESTVGDKGIYLLSFISGVVDVDAITLSLSQMSLNGLSSNMAAQGIIIAAITNTIFKFGFFMIVAKTKKLLFTGLTMIVAGFLGLYLTSLYLQ
ncbi:MAG: MgtC/SapB family protein [Bdellovibrionales bacterium]|nr:MgtC/SapB family protein [Bdellovibrionales bacterium]